MRKFRLIAAAVIASIASAFTALRDFVVAPFRLNGGGTRCIEQAVQAQPSMGLVAAKAYLMRMAQRPRPIDTPLWRMSPVS